MAYACRPRLSVAKNEAFGKRSSNRRNLKTPAFRFRVDGNIWQTDLVENGDIKIIT